MCHEQWHPNRVVMGSGELPSGGKNDETIARSLAAIKVSALIAAGEGRERQLNIYSQWQ